MICFKYPSLIPLIT